MIPRWLGINWWWLLAGNILEYEICVYFHLGAGGWFSGWFIGTWILLQAGWLKRVFPKSRAIFWYLLSFALSICGGFPWHWFVLRHPATFEVLAPISDLMETVSWLVATFVFRADLQRYFNEVDDAGLQLSGWMTFFFSTFYFQYHLHDIYEYKLRSASLIKPSSA